jgi:hypothetical protein
MAGTATKLHVLDCGSMSCDLTWLLLKPGRSIQPRAERDKPVEWYPCTTHAVVVETPDGTMLWDTSCPRDREERWVPTGHAQLFGGNGPAWSSTTRSRTGPSASRASPTAPTSGATMALRVAWPTRAR